MANTREADVATDRYEHEAATTGFWSVEPVHDAIVAARLADVRGASLGERPEPTVAVPGADPAPAALATRGRIRAMRSRVGRALVAFGAFVEGPCDCPEGATRV